jgi:omega-amidase
MKRAAEQGAQLVVLPEIWNGPYATAAFRDYAEVLPNVQHTHQDTEKDDDDNDNDDTAAAAAAESKNDKNDIALSPSAKLLQDHAKDLNMIIVGGSIPELDGDKLYNTCLVYDTSGTLVAKHRKVHLFDIDVPGGIRFKESDTLSPGNTMTAFHAGKDVGMIGIGIWYVLPSLVFEQCACFWFGFQGQYPHSHSTWQLPFSHIIYNHIYLHTQYIQQL